MLPTPYQPNVKLTFTIDPMGRAIELSDGRHSFTVREDGSAQFRGPKGFLLPSLTEEVARVRENFDQYWERAKGGSGVANLWGKKAFFVTKNAPYS
jgi:hypothetical protein